MKQFSKIFGVVIALMLVFTMMAGCMQKPETVTGDYEFSITPDPQTEVTLVVACQASNDERNIITKLGEGFQKYYPKVTIEIQPVSGNLIGTMMGFFQGGNMPDIFQTSSFEMLSLGNAGVTLDLDAYIDAEEAAGTLSRDDSYESFFKLGQSNFDGDQWMIPRAADQVVCHYNARLLREAGVDVDSENSLIKNGWTWEDFLTVCDQVRKSDKWKNSDRTLLDGYLNWEAVFNPIIMSCGGGYYDENNTVIIDNEGTRAALNLMKDLIDKKISSKFTGLQANFQGGEGIFMFHSQAASIQVRNLQGVYGSNFKESDYNVVTFPIIDEENPMVGCGVSGYCVSSTITDQARRDIAWQFLKFMLSKEGQNIIADCGTNYPPIRRDMADPKNPENHWGVGYEAYNLEAFTWASENDAICPTDFILAHAERADDLQTVIETLIGNYIDTGRSLDDSLNIAEQQLEYWLTH